MGILARKIKAAFSPTFNSFLNIDIIKKVSLAKRKISHLASQTQNWQMSSASAPVVISNLASSMHLHHLVSFSASTRTPLSATGNSQIRQRTGGVHRSVMILRLRDIARAREPRNTEGASSQLPPRKAFLPVIFTLHPHPLYFF